MAAPHVTGVLALLASTHPNDGAKQLTKLLYSQATPVRCPADYDLNGTGVQDAYCTGDSSFNSFYGHGLVDALAAVTNGVSAASTNPTSPASAGNGAAFGANPSSDNGSSANTDPTTSASTTKPASTSTPDPVINMLAPPTIPPLNLLGIW